MNNDFVELCKEVQQLRPNMKIRYGGTGGAAFKPKPRPSPMKILKNWIEDNQMRLLDLFNTLDKDKSMNITVKEFADGLKVIVFALFFLMKEYNIGSLPCRTQTLR